MLDPAIGWLVRYGMDFKPQIPGPPATPPARHLWEDFPYGFRIQAELEPDTLWEGFFCPSQNLRNTATMLQKLMETTPPNLKEV